MSSPTPHERWSALDSPSKPGTIVVATIFRATMEDERSAAAPAIPRSVAIFSQRMSRGPSGNVVAALSKGFRDAGVERIYLAYLENGPRPVSTDGITTVRLGAR